MKNMPCASVVVRIHSDFHNIINFLLAFFQFLDGCTLRMGLNSAAKIVYTWDKQQITDISDSKFKQIWLHTDMQLRSQTSYLAPCNSVVSYGAQFGGLWILKKKNEQQMCPQSSRTMQHFTHLYLQTQTTHHSRCRLRTHLANQDCFDFGET